MSVDGRDKVVRTPQPPQPPGHRATAATTAAPAAAAPTACIIAPLECIYNGEAWVEANSCEYIDHGFEQPPQPPGPEAEQTF